MGEETGVSKFYYESGKLWKEINYEHGKMQGSTFLEYNEDGTRNRIFEENFVNNFNEWDLYTSDKSSAKLANGVLEIASTSKEGTSRYINHLVESSEYSIEASINFMGTSDNDKVGIIYGFKDWQNYHYFALTQKYIYVGAFYEGVKSTDIDGTFCSATNPLQKNIIKILCTGAKTYFSVNGEIQFKNESSRFFGNNIGFVLSGNSKMQVDRFVIKEMNVTGSGPITPTAADRDVRATGSGIIFSSSGYVLTNYHVIENSSRFTLELTEANGTKKNYRAELVIDDKVNDLAILKIKDEQFPGLALKYAFKSTGQIDIGGSVFTIGYPHALSGMGKDAKFTDGRISARS
jgi:S1-C subfamily serine protease